MELLFLIIIPFLSACLILCVPRANKMLFRIVALLAILYSSFHLLSILLGFESTGGLQNVAAFPWLPQLGFTLSLGVDGISLPFLALTGILAPVGLLYSTSIQKYEREYYSLYLLLVTGAYGLFLSQNLFFIFFFLEFEILTAYFLISLWGRSPSEKNAFQFMLFAALSGVLFLIFLGLIFFMTGIQNLELAALKSVLTQSGQDFKIPFFFLLGSLTILSALFPFHAWGPLGYQAAERGVNTLLVGVIKKAGPYLLIRLGLELFPQELKAMAPFLIVLCLINIIYVGWVAMAQQDPKLMAGFSSSSHMGYIVLGILSFSPIGLTGALLLSFAHGLVAALLFGSLGRIEEQVGLFRFGQVSGIGRKTPFLYFMFSAGALAAAGLPGLASFTGELMIFFGLLNTHWIVVAFALFGILLSAVYLLRAIKNIFHSEASGHAQISDDKFRGKLAASLLLVSLLIVGIFPRPFVDTLSPQVQSVIEESQHHE